MYMSILGILGILRIICILCILGAKSGLFSFVRLRMVRQQNLVTLGMRYQTSAQDAGNTGAVGRHPVVVGSIFTMSVSVL